MKMEELANVVEWALAQKSPHHRSVIQAVMLRCPRDLVKAAIEDSESGYNMADEVSRKERFEFEAKVMADWAIAILDEAKRR